MEPVAPPEYSNNAFGSPGQTHQKLIPTKTNKQGKVKECEAGTFQNCLSQVIYIAILFLYIAGINWEHSHDPGLMWSLRKQPTRWMDL